MSKPRGIEVTIIVPAHNEEGAISYCLRSLLDSDYPGDKYEIIVVDDGSTDNTAILASAIARDYPSVVLLSQENRGKGSAQNLGLGKCRGSLVLIADADAIVSADWISRMTEDLREADVVLGPCYVCLDSDPSHLEKIQNANYLAKFKHGGLKGTPSVGTNMGFRKAVAEELDGFRTDLKSVTADFIERAQRKGRTIKFNPNIVVRTRGTSSFIGFIKQKLRWREYPLHLLTGKAKPSKLDLIGITYTHGLSLMLFAAAMASATLWDWHPFLLAFVLVLLIDIMLHIKPIWHMSKDKAERNQVPYYLAYLMLMMPVRLILTPYLVYRLLTGVSKATFDGKR